MGGCQLPFTQMENSVTQMKSLFLDTESEMPVRPPRAAAYNSAVSLREAQA